MKIRSADSGGYIKFIPKVEKNMDGVACPHIHMSEKISVHVSARVFKHMCIPLRAT
jgi:hypothetical protein